ncbi:MAG TPA: calcium-binding protein [Rhizomicrobium sp.]|jgi:Ca2+-binding RTX toxin-like protein|nr:calcium-binding protein [Rhizomicrobium sp.]
MSTIVIYSGNSIFNDSGEGQDIADGDTLVVAQGGSIVADGFFSAVSEGNSAISATFVIDGILASGGAVMNLSGHDNSISIGATGSLTGGSVGIAIFGGSNTIVNDGSITTSGFAIRAIGGDNIVENTGVITGGTGTIQLLAGGNTLSNDGLIETSGSQAVALSGDLNSFVNSGTVIAASDAIAINNAAGETSSILNTGTIRSGGLAIDTGAGNDTVQNNGTIIGGISLGDGNDSFTSAHGTLVSAPIDGGAGNDLITGSAGDDVITGGAGADILNGGAGIDWADYSSAPDGVTVSLLTGTGTAGDAAGDTLANFENLIGSAAGNNLLVGDNKANIIAGGAGNDTLTGNGGNDTLESTSGKLIASGGNGNDTILRDGAKLTVTSKIDGGAGNDTLELNGDYSSSLTLKAGTLVNVEKILLDTGHSFAITTNNSNVAAGKTLTIDGSQVDSGHTVVLNGAAETNGTLTLIGGAGNDMLTGGRGADHLSGGTGSDVLNGGGGADYLDGGTQAMSGGAGAGHATTDIFVYGAATDSTSTAFDTVDHFDFSQDKFDIAGTLKGVNMAVSGGALRAAHFDTDLTTALAGHLGAHHAILFTAGSGTYAHDTFLVIDVNGQAGYQAGQDLVIELQHAANLAHFAKADFI